MAFNQSIADHVCEELARGRSLLSISADQGMPSLTTLRNWESEHEEHGANSLRARELGCHALAEECVDIADNDERDWEAIKDQDGHVTGIRVDGEHVQRSRLRIDTRMRLIGKWLPKIYGDHSAVDLNIKKDAADMTDAELQAVIERRAKPEP